MAAMRNRLRLGVALTGALLVTGCGGLDTQSPEQILAAAEAAAKTATGYEISGTGNFGNGVSGVDFRVRGKDVAGTLVASGATIQVAMVGGNVYFQAPASFYEAAGLSATAAAALGNRWVEVPAGSSTAKSFSSLKSLTALASELQHHGPLRLVGSGTADGQKVVRIKDTRNGSTLAVSTDGPAYPVQLEEVNGTDAGTLSFSHWDGVAAITPPANPLPMSGG
jgi:hypothetical protein